VSNLKAENITSGTLTGRSVQTSSSGKRILLSGASQQLVFYASSGNEAGRIDGGGNTGSLGVTIQGRSSAKIFVGIVSTQVTGTLQTVGSESNIIAGGRLAQVTFSSLGTTTTVGRSTTFETQGQFGPAASDLRLKKDIEELSDSLTLINSLRPVKFRFKSEEDGPTSYGLIAQEVQPLFADTDNVVNDMVPSEDEDQTVYLSLEYIQLVAPLIKAVQELSTKVDNIEARLALLEG
jgi:hypothetical protein